MPEANNFDRLREHLYQAAELLGSLPNACPRYHCSFVPADEQECADCWLEWLKEEVKP